MTSKGVILVVDDDAFFRDVCKVKLKEEGYEPILTGSGEDTLFIAREKKPNLILLDLIMPFEDGFGVLEKLKADPDLKKIKVVVVSNLGQEEDIKRALKMGAIGYIIKTDVSLKEMMAKITEYVGS